MTPRRTWRTDVVGAGSCGSQAGRRQFFLIDVEPEEARVTSYAQHPDYDVLFARDDELTQLSVPFPH